MYQVSSHSQGNLLTITLDKKPIRGNKFQLDVPSLRIAYTPQLLNSRQVVKERNSCVVLNKNPLLFRTSRIFILCAFLPGCGLDGWMDTALILIF